MCANCRLPEVFADQHKDGLKTGKKQGFYLNFTGVTSEVGTDEHERQILQQIMFIIQGIRSL